MPTTLTWRPYYDVFHEKERHTVVGNLQIARDVYSPQLNNTRDILVYLPPSYEESERRYPVLYMHDGYNLFDAATSFAAEWEVDETMEQLAHQEEIEAIVVGIPNMGSQRLNEYSPFKDRRHGGGKGDLYLEFIVHTLKPLIDNQFRTSPSKRNTGIMGSSMGGLISLYAFFRHSDVFGFSGVMSPSLWFADGAIFGTVMSAPYQQGRIYLDAGTRELGGSWPDEQLLRARSRRYYASVRRLKRVLANKGYRPTRNLLHIEEKMGGHNEQAWARRLPEAIRFFVNTI